MATDTTSKKTKDMMLDMVSEKESEMRTLTAILTADQISGTAPDLIVATKDGTIETSKTAKRIKPKKLIVQPMVVKQFLKDARQIDDLIDKRPCSFLTSFPPLPSAPESIPRGFLCRSLSLNTAND